MGKLDSYRNEIIDDYKSGTTATYLAKKYDISNWSIKNILIKNNIKIRSSSDLRIKYNDLFFENKSDELYYFWGFILGDGCLATDKKRKWITISLNEKDIEILERFCDWLHIEYDNIKHYKYNVCRLNIYSDAFKQDLLKFGIVSNKTYNPIIPNIEKEYIIPFLLGLLDADGHIDFKYGKSYNIDIVGNPVIMNWYNQQINLLGYNGDIKYFYPKKKWKRIRVRRKNDVINLSKIFNIKKYYHLLLKRKWIDIFNYLN